MGVSPLQVALLQRSPAALALTTGSHPHVYVRLACVPAAQVLDGCDTQDSVKIGVLQQAMTYILETYNVTVLCTSELPLITHGVKSEEVKPLTRVEVCARISIVGQFTALRSVEGTLRHRRGASEGTSMVTNMASLKHWPCMYAAVYACLSLRSASRCWGVVIRGQAL